MNDSHYFQTALIYKKNKKQDFIRTENNAYHLQTYKS